MKNYSIYMNSPADNWENGTPVGNGYTGAMIYGGVKQERIQLNEEYIWAGEKIDTDFPGFRDVINNTRKLLSDGKAPEADEYINKALEGKFHCVKSYETAGEIVIDFDHNNEAATYKRMLNLIDGVASVSYDINECAYSREYFASYSDRVICVRFTAEKPFSFTAHYERFDKNAADKNDKLLNVDSLIFGDKGLSVQAHTVCGAHFFTLKAEFIPVNGSIVFNERSLRVEATTDCRVFININTGKETVLPEILDYYAIRGRHINDFNSLMKRAEIDFGAQASPLSMGERLALMKQGKDDPGVAETYFQFGRYLLVSSSRPGTLPANLQGVWSDYIYAPWNADYHTNINLQMNYWPAETANLSECEEPLNDYINKYLLAPGKRVAEVNYRCRGAVLHHLSDIYQFAAPADGVWGLWPLGGAWLCLHMWEHYLFGGDKEYFEKNGYDYVRECTRFFLDYMFEDENGMLLSGPSTSPENRYFLNGKQCNLCLSPSMDIEIISELLGIFIKASELLGRDARQAEEAKAALKKMPRLSIGKHGQLKEWLEDYDEPEPGHRHISHAFGLHPGTSITRSTPELFEGVRNSVKRRLSFGGGHTGWSAAWLICIHARLKDGMGVHEMINKLLVHSTRDSLLDFHPPFQIDGNFGGAAGIAEAVLQSHEGVIELLPALPPQYANGSFTGLKARGGITVDCIWKNGQVISFKLKGKPGFKHKTSFNGNEIEAAGDDNGIFIYEKA